MAKEKKKTKGIQPKTSPKHAEAELRRKLYEDLGPVEQAARELLDGINKLRHGNLDYIAKLGDLQSTGEAIIEDLGTLGQGLT